MGQQVVSGAELQCDQGSAPGTLTVLPTNMVNADQMPAANINDYIPMLNIASFGMCSSLANPEVVAATAAALGTLTPMPCIPVTASPWTPGSSTIFLANLPTLDDSSTCDCVYAGTITITDPGQTTVAVD